MSPTCRGNVAACRLHREKTKEISGRVQLRREAELPIKPLISRIGQRYGADGDGGRQNFGRRWRAFASLCVFWLVYGLLATARSLRKVLCRYLIFETMSGV